MNSKTKWEEWHAQHRHTHPEITDPLLRAIFANELLIIRRVCKQMNESPFSESMSDQRMGFETALRRVQEVNGRGLEAVYWLNYEIK